MCPIFEYQCPRGHRFDKIVPIALMDEYQECPGKVVEPVGRVTKCKIVSKSARRKTYAATATFKIVPCRAPAKRIPVPSSPAHVIIR